MMTANLQTLWAALQSQKRFNLKSVQTGISLLRQLSHQRHKALKCVCVHSPLSPQARTTLMPHRKPHVKLKCGLKVSLRNGPLTTAGESRADHTGCVHKVLSQGLHGWASAGQPQM